MTLYELTPSPYIPDTDGIFDMPDPAYRAAAGVSQSELKELQESPAHYQAYVTEPKKAPTEAQILGTLFDEALLSPELFPNRYYVRPEGMKFNEKDGIAWKKDHADRPIIYQREHDAIKGMIASIMAHPIASNIVVPEAFRQPSLFCEHPGTGIVRKGRLDLLLLTADKRPAIADVKTCLCNAPRAFNSSILEYGYYIQRGYYSDMLFDLIGEYPFMPFVTVEKHPPYDCVVYQLDADWLKAGRRDWLALLEKYAECVANNNWPGRSATIVTLQAPPYVINPSLPIVL